MSESENPAREALTRTYRLPPRFYEDHRSRACGETGRVLRQTKTLIEVDLDIEAYDDLLSDCRVYIEYASQGAYDEPASMLGLVSSARATLKRLLADPFDSAPREKRRYVFVNPDPSGRPRTFTTEAYDEPAARRGIEREITGSGSWSLEASA